MKNLFKYAASYWKAMIAIVLILVVQAYCDLSLPAYTSDIVNVGIQQGGIEDEVPRQIATEEMEKLLLFVSEDDQQTVMDAYTEDNTSYKKEAYVLKDSVAEEENTMENLKDILQIPMMMTSGIESGSDTTKQMEDKLKEQMSQGMAQSMPQGADQTMPEGMSHHIHVLRRDIPSWAANRQHRIAARFRCRRVILLYPKLCKAW